MSLSPASSSRRSLEENHHDHHDDIIVIEKVVILYASETGNAQDTAERVGREFRRHGRRCTVMSMEMFDIVRLNPSIEW